MFCFAHYFYHFKYDPLLLTVSVLAVFYIISSPNLVQGLGNLNSIDRKLSKLCRCSGQSICLSWYTCLTGQMHCSWINVNVFYFILHLVSDKSFLPWKYFFPISFACKELFGFPFFCCAPIWSVPCMMKTTRSYGSRSTWCFFCHSYTDGKIILYTAAWLPLPWYISFNWMTYSMESGVF